MTDRASDASTSASASQLSYFGRSTSWKLTRSLWMILPLASVGLLAWVTFLWFAIQAKARIFWWATGVSLALAAAVLTVGERLPWLLLVLWVASVAFSLTVNRRLLIFWSWRKERGAERLREVLQTTNLESELRKSRADFIAADEAVRLRDRVISQWQVAYEAEAERRRVAEAELASVERPRASTQGSAPTPGSLQAVITERDRLQQALAAAETALSAEGKAAQSRLERQELENTRIRIERFDWMAERTRLMHERDEWRADKAGSDITKMRMDLARLSTEKSEAAQRQNEMQREVESLLAAGRKAAARLADVKAHNERLLEERASLIAESSADADAQARSEGAVAVLESEVARLTDDLSEAGVELNRLRSHVAELQAEQERLLRETAEARRQATSADSVRADEGAAVESTMTVIESEVAKAEHQSVGVMEQHTGEAAALRAQVLATGRQQDEAEYVARSPAHPVVVEPEAHAQQHVRPPGDWIVRLIAAPSYLSVHRRAGRRAPEHQLVIRLLERLASSGGRLPVVALLGDFGEHESSVRSKIAAVKGVLNVDGYDVLSTSKDGQVLLNEKLARQQFGVEK